jgi:hypothetical protein
MIGHLKVKSRFRSIQMSAVHADNLCSYLNLGLTLLSRQIGTAELLVPELSCFAIEDATEKLEK